MCQKCFSRSAILLAAIVAGQPVPPPTTEELSDHDGWGQDMVDALREATDSVREFAVTGGENPRLDLLLASLSAKQLVAFGTLMDAIKRHLTSFQKLTVLELGHRSVAGDQEALAFLAAQAMEALSRGGQKDTTTIAEVIGGIGINQKVGPHLN